MERPNVFQRLYLSLLIFFRYLVSADFAGRVHAVWQSMPEPAPAPELPAQKPVEKLPPAEPPKPKIVDQSPALHFLAILQREGRLVDFLQEDISAYPDADVGAAARVVHEGCRKALADYVTLEPLRTEGEGARIVVEKGFDAAAIRLTGNVTGEPPYGGALRHHGWKATNVKLPPPPTGQDARIIAPAEVEL